MDLNSKWYHKMLEVANKVAKVPGLKTLLKPIYYPIKQRVAIAQRNKFLENGVSVLQKFDRCLTENNIEYTLAFGTLLGAVREKGFIKHDLDIDVCIWGDQYSKNLVSILHAAGFERIHAFIVEDGSIGREETYKCDGVAIDIFYLYEDGGEYPYCCDFITMHNCPTFSQSMKKYGKVVARKIDLPISKQRVRTKFENIELYIPSNADEVLRFRYGEDYMIPNPNWTRSSYDIHIREWVEKKSYYYEW